MKYAVLGGSFDPVHKGHLSIARSALHMGYDRVIFVPAFSSPFKAGCHREGAEVRLRMLLAAIEGCRAFTADLSEIRREGISYTIDTVRDIYERYVPDGKPGLIIGDDLAHDFYKWKSAGALAELTDIIVAHRLSGGEVAFPFAHKTIQNTIVSCSSAHLRELRNAGSDWQAFVPPAVRDIIIERELYTAAPHTAGEEPAPKRPASLSPRSGLEETARTMLDGPRFLHTRNVALYASALCAEYGLDAEKGWTAGLCHDLCKALEREELVRLSALDGLPFSALEKEKPSLLHGRAAAVLMETVFQIHDSDILEAVRYHTSGRRGMGPLAKIVYLVDKIEPGRHTVERRLRELAFGPPPRVCLDELFSAVLHATVRYLTGRGLTVERETLELLGKR